MFTLGVVYHDDGAGNYWMAFIEWRAGLDDFYVWHARYVDGNVRLLSEHARPVDDFDMHFDESVRFGWKTDREGTEVEIDRKLVLRENSSVLRPSSSDIRICTDFPVQAPARYIMEIWNVNPE